MGRIERPGCTTDPAATGELLRMAKPLHNNFEAPLVHPITTEVLQQWNGIDRRDHRSSRQKDGERCVEGDPEECQSFYDNYAQETQPARTSESGSLVKAPQEN